MNKLTIAATATLAALFAASVIAQAQQSQPPGFQPKAYFQVPLEKDPSRVVRMQNVVLPAGAANQFHRHPGDQWWAVQDGEVTFTIKGEQPRVLKAGDSVYVPRGTVHRNQNLTDKPARAIEVNVTDKDQPQTEQVAN